MFSQLVNQYSAYKQRFILEQLLRVSNSMFAVFAYWNLVRAWAVGQFEDGISCFLVCAIIVTLLTGIIFGALLVISFRLRMHVWILPATLFACAATLEVSFLKRLFLVPALALLSLVLVRVIISAANKIHRW